MIEVQILVLGGNQTNCYILRKENSRECVVMDPGYTPEVILAHLQKERLTCQAILLTHGHFDHVGGVSGMVDALGCPVYICEKDLSLPYYITAGPLRYTDGLEEGDTLELAGMIFSVLHTPGHTPGSVCFAVEDHLFTGDTLFEGCCGRMDLPGGSFKEMRHSMARLNALEGEYTVYPGHGNITKLSIEKTTNPFLMKRL